MDAITFRKETEKIEVIMNSKFDQLVQQVDKKGDTFGLSNELYDELRDLSDKIHDEIKNLRFDL